MPHIDGMIVQSDGSRPHVVYIMSALARAFPNIIWKIGGQKDRDTWGGTPSAHKAGRACDIYLDANERLDKKLGDLLFDLFIVQALILKVDHVIWDTQWSNDGTSPTAYTGSGGPHKDHVHVAFKNDHLEVKPYIFEFLLQGVVAQYGTGGDGAADRMDGLYGKAFDPKRPHVRLSGAARKKIMLKKMGMEGAE
jgi:hypothetical protein